MDNQQVKGTDMIDKAIEILRTTNDGERLSPTDLKLTELAVNGFLSQEGERAFEDLYERAVKREYVPPFFQGVQHITRDHQGYILYKGKIIEHFDAPYCYSPEAKAYLERLSAICQRLENEGKEIKGMWMVIDIAMEEEKEAEALAV